MKRLVNGFVIATVAVTVVHAELPPGWGTNLTVALAVAKERQQPVVAFYTASWCGPCRLMVRSTLTNDSVIQALNSVGHVAIDIDEQSALAQEHRISAVPTFQLLSSDGIEITHSTGYQSATPFLDWLGGGLALAKERSARRAQFEQSLAAVDELVRGSDSAGFEKAAALLFEVLAAGDDSNLPAALVRVKALGRRSPGALLDGLKHSKLVVRIHCANALRQELGDDFQIDPWSDAAAREAGVGKWRAFLTPAR